MPLIQSKSDKAFKENLKAEMHAGKPQKQALAIAYSVKREAGKAHGGEVMENKDRTMHAVRMSMGGKACPCPRCDSSHMAEGGMVDEENRKLAMNDTYPEGAAESDTQAQDEGFGQGPMDNEEGNEDQEEARRRTRAARALTMARMNG